MKKLIFVLMIAAMFTACKEKGVIADTKYPNLTMAVNDKAVYVGMSEELFTEVMTLPLDVKEIDSANKVIFADGYVIVSDRVIEIRLK